MPITRGFGGIIWDARGSHNNAPERVGGMNARLELKVDTDLE